MTGCYKFEIEKWKEALDAFNTGRKIFTELASISDSLQKIIYNERIEQLDQSIRYCNHKLGLKGQGVSDLLDLKNRAHDPTMLTKIDVYIVILFQKYLILVRFVFCVYRRFSMRPESKTLAM